MRANTFTATLIKTGFVASILLLASGVAFAQSVNLTAGQTTAMLPDGQSVPMWGYTCTGIPAGATCAAANPSAGTNWSPVVITVPYNPLGTSLTINLTNSLQPTTTLTPIPTSLVIVGQLGGGLGGAPTRTTSPTHPAQGVTWFVAGPPDPSIDCTTSSAADAAAAGTNCPPAQLPRVQSFATEVAQGATTALCWGPACTVPTPTLKPGTYLVHSGTHPSIQAPMGLYGVLVVTTPASSTTPAQAYPGVTYDADVPLVLGEIDPVQNAAVDTAVRTVGFSETAVWTRQGAGGPVTAISIVNGGTGYTAPPNVTISGGSGSNATAIATISAGVVTAITVTNAGDGYSSPLSVTIDPPPSLGTQATATATVTLGGCGGDAHTCYPPAVNYDPRYYLINGVSFDRTNLASSTQSILAPVPPATTVPATTGRVLLRFVNAGLRMHVPSVVGANMSLLAEDGNILPGIPKVQTQVFLAAGKTYDVTIQPTQSSPATYAPATYAVYDRQLSLSTNNQRDGGMQAYIKVAGGSLPVSGATLSATDKTYYCVAGVTLEVTDPSKGLLAGATGANGAVLVTPTSLIGGDTSLVFQSNGTFTYTPPSSDCGGLFTYLVNGTLSRTATITRCDASTPGCAALGGAPAANNDSYTSTIASRLQVSPPGVLINDTDPSGLPLKVDLTSVTKTGGNAANLTLSVNPNGDGSFTASATAPGTYTFTYNAVNSQKTSSAANTVNPGPATVTLIFPPPTNLTVAIKDAKTGLAINDYRWIIEEDRTFYVDPKCQVNSTNPALRPASCPPLPIPALGTNFHTSYMPVVASGCVVPVDSTGAPLPGGVSCEFGQSLLGTAAACDIGNGACRTDAAQKTPVNPSQAVLDPTKRYYLSILPGDGGNPTVNGGGGPMQVDPTCDPATTQCAMRQFDIAKDCPNASDFAPGTGVCGHAMGGAPISSAQVAAGSTTTINVNLQQTPLPTANIAVFVFQDDWPLNGEQDSGGGVDVLAPQEPGLGGFELKVFDQAGGFGDSTGQATYDMFNMPLSNSLAGMKDPVTGQDACPITKRTDGLVGMIPTCPKYMADGTTLSPLAGQALIANLYPGLYEIVATPAADRIARGEEWLQTNTLDGTKPHEAFIKPNEPGYFQEFGPGGFHVAIGFANPAIINARKAGICAPPTTCTSTINGLVTNARMSRTPDQRVYSSGSYDSYSFTTCYVSLGYPDSADFAFTKCNPDGTFTFNNVPTGNFKVTVFDQWNDLLVDGLSTPVKVAGSSVNVEIPVTQWRTNIYTRTFIDVNGDGVSQPSEPGLALVSTNIRYRDGSYGFFNNTDLDGYAGFNEVFPFLNWLVVETSTTRFKPTGVHVVNDAGGPVDGTTGGGSSTIAAALANTIESPTAHLPTNLRIPGARYCATADCTGTGSFDPTSGNAGSTGRVDPPWATTQAWQGLLGQNSFIEWGMKAFKPATANTPGENGGINGHVIYASTRPFDDPALYLQLSWLPMVPNVTLNLYQVGTAPDGTRSLKLVDTTKTSSWDDWAQGFRSDGVSNMNCPGQETSSPFFFTLNGSKQWLDPLQRLIPGDDLKTAEMASRFKCYDGWSMLNQVQPATYDGMYKFPSIIGRNPQTGAPTGAGSVNGTSGSRPGSNCTICVANPDDGTPMLPSGKYVVEVILPPGYELVKEEDKNLLLGDVYIAPVTQQFAGLGNVFIIPDQAAINAYYNKNNPLIQTTNFGLPRHEGDTGSVETFWPCVGAMRVVPDWMSLFVGATQNAPFAGASRPLCDRKEVILKDEMSVLAKFFVFSSTHVAGHFTGTITNDFASEFDPFSPQFGEKFAPPNMPVSFKDFAGNEVSRVYSDQWGIFNGLYFSTYGVNPPNPTGYVPQMAIACMNDSGPIPDPAHPGQTMTDPLYNPAYSNFCYETPFMPGQTQYMDTPVIPTMAFAEGYNLPDCDYPDTTPAIKTVHGPSNSGAGGPWVSSAGQTLTITALGDKTVLNHAYSGPRASTAPFNQKFITRHYGFGARPSTCPTTGNCLSATIAGVPMTNVTTWTDTQIVGAVPSLTPAQSTCTIAQRTSPTSLGTSARCGELVITAANGKQSIDSITVTLAGKPPTYVNGENSAGNALQTAIDNATPGDLIIVAPGKYKEMLLMWKPVRLQGVGAASVTIDADAHPAGRLDPWRRQVNCLFGLALNGQPISGTNPYDATGTYTCSETGPNPMRQKIDRIPLEGIVGWDTTFNGNLAEMLQEPTLMGAYEGAGITVLGKGVRIPADSTDFFGIGGGAEANFPVGYQYLTGSNTDCNATSVDPGRDYATSNFNCNPSRIDGVNITNSSQGGGAIYLHGWNHRMEIANTRIYANHGTLAGGINVGTGEFPVPFINDGTALPFPVPPGTPIGAQLGYGLQTNVRVHHNAVTSNASIGDALFSGTPSAAGGVTIYPGSDDYQFKNNWVCGNLSTGDGGGVAHAGFNANGNISNNWILFNQSANPTIPTHGGGLAILGAASDRTLTTTGTECGSTNDVDCPPGIGEGTGPGLVIDSNLIMGNSAESGSGGGLRLQNVNATEVSAFPFRPDLWYQVTVTNNIIANNVAGWDGGGVSMQDALKVNFINNTVISNDTTGSAGVLFNTLGAPLAANPPPGCTPQEDPSLPQDPSCTGNAPDSTYQPVGLVTMQNSPNLTASLPALVLCPIGHSSGFGALLPIPNGNCRYVSYPLLRNNVFWQNRAFHITVGDFGSGLQNQQHLVALVPMLNQATHPTGFCVPQTGANDPLSTTQPYYWDIGVRGDTGPTNHSSTFTLEPRYSILTSTSGYTGYMDANNLAGNPAVVRQYCNGSRLPPENGGLGYSVPPGRSETTGLSPVFTMNSITPAATVDEGNNWINLGYGPLALNNSALYTVANTVLATLGDYSITGSSSALNNASPILAPNHDFFGRTRPQGGGFDRGAVEFVAATVAAASVSGGPLAFGNVAVGVTSAAQTLTLNNTGTGSVTGISLVFSTWFERAASPGTCATTATFTLTQGSSCTINVVFRPTQVGAVTDGTLTIHDSVVVTGSPVTLTGTGVATPAKPAPAELDNFNRANATTLGTNWSQIVLLGAASIRVNANQAFDTVIAGAAYWNGAGNVFGAKQAATFTFVQNAGSPAAPLSGSDLVLKASGGSATVPANFVRVRYTGTEVIVETTTNVGVSFTTQGTFAASFVSGDTLTAQVDASGTAYVWKTTAANVTTFIGGVGLGASWTGTGRIGMQLPVNARVDNFAGGTVP